MQSQLKEIVRRQVDRYFADLLILEKETIMVVSSLLQLLFFCKKMVNEKKQSYRQNNTKRYKRVEKKLNMKTVRGMTEVKVGVSQ